MFETIIETIRSIYPGGGPIPLHVPRFTGNERKFVLETIDSTFVSSVGPFVTQFEEMIKAYTGASFAVATVNGTSALHMALILAGVERDTEVLTQALTFVATANAIKYCGAEPVFIDSDKQRLGMSAERLEMFLKQFSKKTPNGARINAQTGRRIAACVPMHVFGHPVDLDAILQTCNDYGIPCIEDAAESLGSTYRGKHSGTMGTMGILSFNGNKTVTTGGGGMIITNDEAMGIKAKHLTTTAKIPHVWDFFHDQVGYNYRMPNINAALGCAQLEQLPDFISQKRKIAEQYQTQFKNKKIHMVLEPESCKSNYWLNAIAFADKQERDQFLKYSNEKGVMTRPIWHLMVDLPMYRNSQHDGLENARWLQDRIVNIPSSVPA